MMALGKVFRITPRKPKKVEVDLSNDTKKMIIEQNKTSSEQIEIQREALECQKQNLMTKDRVEISLVEYNKMIDELKELRKFKEWYLKLVKPIIKNEEISEDMKAKILEGKELRNPRVMVQANPFEFNTKVMILFEVDGYERYTRTY